MIDLHSHVLPGLDDGPDTMDESLDFVRAAAAQGTTVLAATPHLREDYPDIEVETLPEACEELNERIPAELDFEVISGGEVDLIWAQHATSDELRYASFGQLGKDLLVETPYGLLHDNFEDLLFQVAVRGYRILLAHPERNPSFQRNPNRLRAIAQRGVLLQITLPSVLRDKSSNSRKLAFNLVREGLAHNLASDSHSSSGHFRPPDLRSGVQVVAEFAPAYAEWMVTDAPAAVLEGVPLPPPPSVGSKPRRGLRLPGRRKS
jgi:protein-tyrosine phosphatase